MTLLSANSCVARLQSFIDALVAEQVPFMLCILSRAVFALITQLGLNEMLRKVMWRRRLYTPATRATVSRQRR
jgi:hypothetical protein